MSVHKTREFIDGLEGLPFKIKKLYKKQEFIFKKIGLIPVCISRGLRSFQGYIHSESQGDIGFYFISVIQMQYFSV
jgi:hypothetical protein